jgi:hypothetical protein
VQCLYDKKSYAAILRKYIFIHLNIKEEYDLNDVNKIENLNAKVYLSDYILIMLNNTVLMKYAIVNNTTVVDTTDDEFGVVNYSLKLHPEAQFLSLVKESELFDPKYCAGKYIISDIRTSKLFEKVKIVMPGYVYNTEKFEVNLLDVWTILDVADIAQQRALEYVAKTDEASNCQSQEILTDVLVKQDVTKLTTYLPVPVPVSASASELTSGSGNAFSPALPVAQVQTFPGVLASLPSINKPDRGVQEVIIVKSNKKQDVVQNPVKISTKIEHTVNSSNQIIDKPLSDVQYIGEKNTTPDIKFKIPLVINNNMIPAPLVAPGAGGFGTHSTLPVILNQIQVQASPSPPPPAKIQEQVRPHNIVKNTVDLPHLPLGYIAKFPNVMSIGCVGASHYEKIESIINTSITSRHVHEENMFIITNNKYQNTDTWSKKYPQSFVHDTLDEEIMYAIAPPKYGVANDAAQSAISLSHQRDVYNISKLIIFDNSLTYSFMSKNIFRRFIDSAKKDNIAIIILTNDYDIACSNILSKFDYVMMYQLPNKWAVDTSFEFLKRFNTSSIKNHRQLLYKLLECTSAETCLTFCVETAYQF